MRKINVSVILPTYNEAGNIAMLISQINRVIPPPKEILIIDDDSPDNTAKIAYDHAKRQKIKGVKVIVRKHNHGLTASIWEGIEKSKGEIIIWMDCDFSHPPEVIPKLLQKINGGYDIAVASRFVQGGGFKKNLKDSNDSDLAVVLSRIMNYFIQLVLDNNFNDYTSGFIAIRRQIFKDIKLQGDYGEYFIDLMTRAILLKYRFVEIPFVNLPRKYGESKTGTNLTKLLSRGIKYISTSLKLLFLKVAYNLGLSYDIRSQNRKFR